VPLLPVILDPALNYFPDNIHHIHLMGICGTAMGALAGMLKSKGYKVTGSDQHVYPPMSDFLSTMDIPVLSGYRPANLNPVPDLVVVGNVITAKNPEAVALDELKIPYVSLPQALAEKFIGSRKSLVVCGTHGKTTTSSLLATMLSGAGLNTGFMIGGLVQAFGRNFHIGDSDYFVVEGDEYDTAFFDKGPKFLHYRPYIAILTSIEFDHADIYADFAAVKKSFSRLVAVMPEDGCLVACFDDPVVREIVAEADCRVISYGQDEKYDWSLSRIEVGAEQTRFAAVRQGGIYGEFAGIMPGLHNCLNSLAVIAVFDLLGISAQVTARELSRFKGVRRRQEVRGRENGITVIDDFAHHPTAVRETLAALAAAYKGHRLVAVFEPRTNSSRRSIFQKDYAAVFDPADEVVIREPVKLPGLKAEEMFSAADLAEDLQKRGVRALSFADTDKIIDYLLKTLAPKDVVVIMSNGGFDNIHVRLLSGLADG
jgi:UDP-N-acetylmuramate: L-alanyl-gamma-D-glutamyl-meso-diaminopimelate ligase